MQQASEATPEQTPPPQPVPCIGIGPGAHITFTEEQAEEAIKIALERAAVSCSLTLLHSAIY
jgi:hypothetical protein